ncbi:MAG: nucleotidyltransferase domain-containing protein [Candidatus Methanoperedens sp.]|nr:nucleotidyltransferase domain-containing protein [Candidatus Methanoperedens sp.]
MCKTDNNIKFIHDLKRNNHRHCQKDSERFNPEKIILFGSYAWGKPDRDSDLDLFVVMESKERPIKRAASLRCMLKDRYVPMDILVRTPEELKQRLDIGDPFIMKILRDGQVIYARDSTRG